MSLVESDVSVDVSVKCRTAENQAVIPDFEIVKHSIFKSQAVKAEYKPHDGKLSRLQVILLPPPPQPIH